MMCDVMRVPGTENREPRISRVLSSLLYCSMQYAPPSYVRHDQRNRAKKSSAKSRGWINEISCANNTTRFSSARGTDIYYFHEHPRHDLFFGLFATTGEVFSTGRGKILPVSHQEGTFLPLSSSGEANYYFLLDFSCVGLVRFKNPLPTAVPIYPNLQN